MNLFLNFQRGGGALSFSGGSRPQNAPRGYGPVRFHSDSTPIPLRFHSGSAPVPLRFHSGSALYYKGGLFRTTFFPKLRSVDVSTGQYWTYLEYSNALDIIWEGRWPRGRVDVSEPGGPGFDSSSRQPQVVAHQH